MTHVYYKEASGAIVVYDVSNPKSLESIKKWKNNLDKDVPGIPVVLVGNKVLKSI